MTSDDAPALPDVSGAEAGGTAQVLMPSASPPKPPPTEKYAASLPLKTSASAAATAARQNAGHGRTSIEMLRKKMQQKKTSAVDMHALEEGGGILFSEWAAQIGGQAKPSVERRKLRQQAVAPPPPQLGLVGGSPSAGGAPSLLTRQASTATEAASAVLAAAAASKTIFGAGSEPGAGVCNAMGLNPGGAADPLSWRPGTAHSSAGVGIGGGIGGSSAAVGAASASRVTASELDTPRLQRTSSAAAVNKERRQKVPPVNPVTWQGAAAEVEDHRRGASGAYATIHTPRRHAGADWTPVRPESGRASHRPRDTMAEVLTMGEWLEKRDAAAATSTPRRRSAERRTTDTMADVMSMGAPAEGRVASASRPTVSSMMMESAGAATPGERPPPPAFGRVQTVGRIVTATSIVNYVGETITPRHAPTAITAETAAGVATIPPLGRSVNLITLEAD